MADVFLSYKREDSVLVRPIVIALETAGWSVFWDPNIRPGHTFDELIEAELDIAKAVIVVWSKRAIRSDWVRAEAQRGKERNILVPITLDGTAAPIAFSLMQTGSLVGWSGSPSDPAFLSIRARVEELAGRPQPRTALEERKRLEAEAFEVWNDICESTNKLVMVRFSELYAGTPAAELARARVAKSPIWAWSTGGFDWPLMVSGAAGFLTGIGLEHFYGLPLIYNTVTSIAVFFILLTVLSSVRRGLLRRIYRRMWSWT